jgi:hypothetical protein
MTIVLKFHLFFINSILLSNKICFSQFKTCKFITRLNKPGTQSPGADKILIVSFLGKAVC